MPEVILSNAGNFRAIFDNEKDGQIVVKYLPKLIAKNAYGLQIIQAVVDYDGDYKSTNSKLESRLKIARNKIAFPLDFSLLLLKHNPKTALPLIPQSKNGEKCDKSTFQKLQRFESFDKAHPNSINELSQLCNDKNKIALIYADGNALGAIVRNLDKNEMKDFSQKLDSATKDAFKKACESTKENLTQKDSFKIREVICGGDDLVVVCNADIALDFAKNFLAEFEKQTQNIHKGKNLNACAGIAFFNHKYPIHYGLKLAKDLCAHAKRDSKAIDSTLPPSCLMFHNIQSSAVQSFENFIKDELTLNANSLGVNSQSKAVRLDFGAYFLHKLNNSTPTIQDLQNLIAAFRAEDAPTSRLRQWLSILESNRNLADNELKQIAKIYATFGDKNLTAFKAMHKDLSLQNLITQKDGIEKTPIYDIISIISNTAEVFKLKD